MAKTLLEFENILIDVMEIKRVDKLTEWDDIKEDMVHKIVFNREVPDYYILQNKEFTYDTSEVRDKQFQLLKRKIGEMEHIIIL